MRLTKNNTNLITLLNQIRKLYLNLKRKHDKNESNLVFLQYTITSRYSKDRKKQLMRNFMETILVVSIGLFLSHFVRFRTMESAWKCLSEEIYSIGRKGHKTKTEKANGDYNVIKRTTFKNIDFVKIVFFIPQCWHKMYTA